MTEKASYWIVAIAIITLTNQGICGDFQTNTEGPPLTTFERWEAIGKYAGDKSVDMITKASAAPQKGNMIVLTNAGYAEVNGASTQGALDGLIAVTGASRGRNTLIEIHSSSWAPLWFAVFDKASGYCAYLELDPFEAAKIAIDAARVSAIFAVASTERIDAGHLFQHASEYEAKFNGKVVGGNEFRIVTIVNAVAAGAPAYVVRTIEFHNHYCPAGISDAAMAPALRSDGKAAGRWDTESIAEDGGILYVGVEGDNQILRFEYGKKGFLARGIPIADPPGVKDLPNNQGLEGLVFIPEEYPLGGALIAFSECGLNEAGDIKAFLIGGPNPGAFSVRRTGKFDITDAALLPGGDLLILERQYSEQTGVALRIRCIPLAKIKPGATVDGRIVIEADRRHVIDNMEALSVHRIRSGAIVLTLMSDDNFSSLQRTLLLQFTLIGDGISESRPGTVP